ncbi:hypothetical protein PMAYCL1PPCAC_16717, partial [Pristionchus mayeri]
EGFMGTFAQFRLLLWKSIRTAIRSPIWTIFEIALPLIAFALLIVATRQGPPQRPLERPKDDMFYTSLDFEKRPPKNEYDIIKYY